MWLLLRLICPLFLATGPPPPLPPRPVVRQNDDAQTVSKPSVQSKNLEKVADSNIISSGIKDSELNLNQDNKAETSATTSRRSSFSSTIVSFL